MQNSKLNLGLKIFCCFLAATILFVEVSSAKDLNRRLGIGIKNNRTVSVPQLAAVYYPADLDLALTGGIGIDTEESRSRFAFDVGVRRIVFKEPNLNFYMGGDVGLINYETAAVKNSGYELRGVFGAEFFLTGLDSLGFSFEGGVGILSTDKVRFRTFADNPFRAGMIFYF